MRWNTTVESKSDNSDLLKFHIVAAPCSVSWAGMQKTENEAVRACQGCSKNVYNLSAMTRKEAEELLSRTDGQICTRFYRRFDGTVMTDDCPVGLRRIRDGGRETMRTAAAIIAFTVSTISALAQQPNQSNKANALSGSQNQTQNADSVKANSNDTKQSIDSFLSFLMSPFFHQNQGPITGQRVPRNPDLDEEKNSPANTKARDAYAAAKASEKGTDRVATKAKYEEALRFLKVDNHDPAFRKMVIHDYVQWLCKNGYAWETKDFIERLRN